MNISLHKREMTTHVLKTENTENTRLRSYAERALEQTFRRLWQGRKMFAVKPRRVFHLSAARRFANPDSFYNFASGFCKSTSSR